MGALRQSWYELVRPVMPAVGLGRRAVGMMPRNIKNETSDTFVLYVFNEMQTKGATRCQRKGCCRGYVGSSTVHCAAGVLPSCGMSAEVSPQILLRLCPWIVGLNGGGRSWWGALSRSLFRGFAAKGALILAWKGLYCGFG